MAALYFGALRTVAALFIAEAQMLEDFKTAFIEKVSSGELQEAISGTRRRLRPSALRALSSSILDGATVDTDAQTDLIDEASTDPDVNESRLGKIEDSNDGGPRSGSTEAYRELDARLSEQSSSARDLMTAMLGANTVSAAELQERKLKTRDADESIQHLAFLFEEYEPRCYQFVVFECVRKLALTGLLIFMYPGSASQIAIGLLIAFLSMQVYTYSRPYIADADDNLANVGNAQIILVFIASLMLFIKDMDEQDGAPGDMFKGPVFSYAMIVIGTLVLVATIYTILVETCEVNPDEDVHMEPFPKKSNTGATAPEEEVIHEEPDSPIEFALPLPISEDPDAAEAEAAERERAASQATAETETEMVTLSPTSLPSEVTEAEFHWQDTSGKQRGPSTWTEYKAAFESGETGLDNLVYAAGITDGWTAARNVSCLAEQIAKPSPPGLPKANWKPPPPPPRKAGS